MNEKALFFGLYAIQHLIIGKNGQKWMFCNKGFPETK